MILDNCSLLLCLAQLQQVAAHAAAVIPQPGQQNQPSAKAKQAAFGRYTSKEYVGGWVKLGGALLRNR